MAEQDKEASDQGEAAFDALSLRFPTDKITIRDLIQRFPKTFAWDWETFGSYGGNVEAFERLQSAMTEERELAELAFQAAKRGQDVSHLSENIVSYPNEPLPMTRGELLESISGAYQRLGIANGLAETKVLVQRFESAAAQQATQGRPR